MKGKFKFTGEGGKLFCLIFVQGLLTTITLGIYGAWALKNILAYLADNTTLDGKKFQFTGDGGDIFSLFVIQYLLTGITGGIYGPWAALKIRRYFAEKLTYDGKPFAFNDDNGCDFFCLLFVQNLLIGITAGIYYPWAMINIMKNLLERTSWDGARFTTSADGGKLFSLLLGQSLLSVITLGIYTPWAVAKIYNYLVSSITRGDNDRFDMDLQGGDLFSLLLIHGGLLIGLTLGIYYPWYLCKTYSYIADRTEIK